MSVWRNFLSNREGATAVEYGIVVAIICGMLIAAFTTISDNVLTVLTNVAAFLKV